MLQVWALVSWHWVLQAGCSWCWENVCAVWDLLHPLNSSEKQQFFSKSTWRQIPVMACSKPELHGLKLQG
jgi:hypothetical protein